VLWQVREKIGCSEPMGLVFGLEEFVNEGLLSILSKVGSGDGVTCGMGDWLGETLMFPIGERGHIDIGTAVEKAVVTTDTGPQAGLQINHRLIEPQRLRVIDGGLGADEVTGFIVLLDGVAAEPVFNAGIIIVEPPEGLGRGATMRSAGEDLGDSLGQSEAMEFIQETFKEAGTKACRVKHDVGGYFDLGGIPVMVKEAGAGGIGAFVEPEEEIHPVVDSVEDGPSVE